jgi:hypothetical protein
VKPSRLKAASPHLIYLWFFPEVAKCALPLTRGSFGEMVWTKKKNSTYLKRVYCQLIALCPFGEYRTLVKNPAIVKTASMV